jgi:transposase InsO family protein
MRSHRNAKLGLAGCYALVIAVERDCSLSEAARRRRRDAVASRRRLPAPWSTRWRAASVEERRTLASLERPRCSPRMLPAEVQARLCPERRRSGHGPRVIGGRLRCPHATVWKALRRGGCSGPEARSREPARRYEWPCRGDLLHVDWTTLARFAEPGHAATGDRTSSSDERRRRLGYDVAHAIVDDHSRFAYAAVLADAKARTVTGFVGRALAAFPERGIQPRRLMSDNAWSYVKNRSLRELLARRGIRHLTTKPRRPRTNGKLERFHPNA